MAPVTPWLTIALPSARPDDLAGFVASLEQHADSQQGWTVLAATPHGMTVPDRVQRLECSPGTRLMDLFATAATASQTPWVWIANDDLLCETDGWDTTFQAAASLYPDEIGLIWPDDRLFGPSVACFPMTSRKVLNLTQFWPVPYRRYRVDDHLHDIFKRLKHSGQDRMTYLGQVHMRHLNVDTQGTYRIDRAIEALDEADYQQQAPRRSSQASVLAAIAICESRGRKLLDYPVRINAEGR